MQNRKVRVFSRAVPDEPETYRYYGCLRRTGKRTLLADAFGNQYVNYGPTVFRLRGSLVAYAAQFCGLDNDCDASAYTVDLRSGKQTRAFDDRSPAYTGIADLRVAASGSLGLMEYAVRYAGDSGPSTNSVVTVTAGGSRVVDSGEDVDHSSLALGGPWLYWTHAGQPRSTPLP